LTAAFQNSTLATMTTPLLVPGSMFRRALEEFKATLSPNEVENFQLCTLDDLKCTIISIQGKQLSERRAKNLTRLNSFLEGMEQYEEIIKVLLNTTDVLAFIWVGIALPFYVYSLQSILSTGFIPGPRQIHVTGSCNFSNDAHILSFSPTLKPTLKVRYSPSVLGCPASILSSINVLHSYPNPQGLRYLMTIC
jgi:hypothetical protein